MRTIVVTAVLLMLATGPAQADYTAGNELRGAVPPQPPPVGPISSTF